MGKKDRIVERYVAFILRHRLGMLLAIGLVTAFFGYKAYHLRIATDFFTLYPPKHPYIQLYNEYRQMFGSANVLVAAVEVKEGDIYNLETIAKIDRITKYLMGTEGCDALQVVSITHPRLKNVQVKAWGITMEPVMFPGLPTDQTGLDRMKDNVYSNEGIRGFYVSPDDKTAAIFAGFWEEGLKPLALHNRLATLKEQESDENTRIHFTGYPVLYGYIYALASQLYLVLGLTILVIIGLLYYFFRTWQGVVFPVTSAVVSGVWGLGFASMLGFSLDPLILVVPLIITARAISHSVQCMTRYHEEYVNIGVKKEAIIRGYGELFMPATLSIVTDAIGILMISVATIPLMRNLGIFASFWILTIVVSVPTLSPILLSFVNPPGASALERESKGKIYDVIAAVLLKPSQGKGRWVVLALVILIAVIGGNYAAKLKVGNTEAGAAILFPDHPYNKSFKFFNQNFVGATQMIIIAEGKNKEAIKTYETLRAMEDFQRYMETEGGSAGTLTFSNMVKRINRMFHEGHPKWEKVPKDKKALAEIGFILESNTSAGEMDRYLDTTWTNGTITCFYKEYNNESIKNTLAKAETFIENNPSDRVRFRLAGGLLGILAAVNEEVEYSYWVSMAVVFSAVFILCILSFRSVTAGVILIIPLMISQILADVFMYAKGIDLNINSLPVTAIAVGIGIDYGIYLMARISEEYQIHGDYNIANSRALKTTGKAIIFTATTLIAGVIFWGFVDVKFQAEMGLLLGLLMLLNMFDALILIPSLVSIFRPKFVSGRKVE